MESLNEVSVGRHCQNSRDTCAFVQKYWDMEADGFAPMLRRPRDTNGDPVWSATKPLQPRIGRIDDLVKMFDRDVMLGLRTVSPAQAVRLTEDEMNRYLVN